MVEFLKALSQYGYVAYGKYGYAGYGMKMPSFKTIESENKRIRTITDEMLGKIREENEDTS